MTKYALVKNALVVNLIVWDGNTKIQWDDGVAAVLCGDNATVAIGDTYNSSDGTFTAPSETTE